MIDVDSLICGESTVISPDFLDSGNTNYLHLMVKSSGLNIINPSFNTLWEDNENSTLDDYILEIGCKVTEIN